MILDPTPRKALARVRVTLWQGGQVDYQVKRMAQVERSALIKALRSAVVAIEREELTRIYGPMGETLTMQAKLGDMS